MLLVWLAAAAAAAAFLRCNSEIGAGLSLATCTATAVTGIAACVGAGLIRGGMPAQRALALGLLVAGFINAAIGPLQYYGVVESFASWITEPGIGQAYGSLRQRNQFVTLLSMALIAALWLHAGYRGV